jgi:hypothetical protein
MNTYVGFEVLMVMKINNPLRCDSVYLITLCHNEKGTIITQALKQQHHLMKPCSSSEEKSSPVTQEYPTIS